MFFPATRAMLDADVATRAGCEAREFWSCLRLAICARAWRVGSRLSQAAAHATAGVYEGSGLPLAAPFLEWLARVSSGWRGAAGRRSEMFWPARGSHAARLRVRERGPPARALCRRFWRSARGRIFGRATPIPEPPRSVHKFRPSLGPEATGSRWCWRATGKGFGRALCQARAIRAAPSFIGSDRALIPSARCGGGGFGPVRNHEGRASGEIAPILFLPQVGGLGVAPQGSSLAALWPPGLPRTTPEALKAVLGLL
jgi:hypothetical protein